MGEGAQRAGEGEFLQRLSPTALPARGREKKIRPALPPQRGRVKKIRPALPRKGEGEERACPNLRRGREKRRHCERPHGEPVKGRGRSQ